MASTTQESADAVVVFDNLGMVNYANEAFCILLGCRRKLLIGKDLGDQLAPNARNMYRESLLPILTTGQDVSDIYLPVIDKEGNEIPTLMSGGRRRYRSGHRNVGVFSKVIPGSEVNTQLFQAQQEAKALRLENQLLRTSLGFAYSALVTQTRAWKKFKESLGSMAYQDPLTGLINRRGFEMRFEEEAASFAKSNIPFSLLMIDVDHFKEVNDTLGHARGDEVLKKVSVLLTQTMRKLDFVARWGGDEFVALLPETAKDAAILAGERIRRAVETEGIDVTVSIGAATFDSPSSTCSKVMANADRALYAAKNIGRNQVVHESNIDDLHDRRKDVEHQLR